MSKNITFSSWYADNLPNGISFDANGGVFSGSPNVTPGEYLVPVSVSTNYGSDSKDIRFIVDETANPVYAIGAMAAQWSNNSQPDSYGFRKLNIPNASRVNSIPAGFAAKCSGGKWYIGSSSSLPIYGGNGFSKGNSYYSPDVFDVDDVLDIKGGKMNNDAAGLYFAYQTPDETAVFGYSKSSSAYNNNFKLYTDNIKFLHKDFAYGFAASSLDNEIFISASNNVSFNYSAPAHVSDLPVKALCPNIVGASLAFFFLDTELNLFEFSNNVSTRPDTDVPQIILSDVSDFWLRFGGRQIWALKSNGQLFARGNNISYILGHTDDSVNFKDFTYIGDFNAKKIESPFMLTQDGKLFHSGLAVSGITSQHNGWTHIFPEYTFQDFSYIPGDASGLGTKTLTAIIKERA